MARALIRWYQMIVRPLMPPCCRFHPSCSQYAIDAIDKYGLFRGLMRAARRILKCHPFHPGGFDAA